MLEKKEKVLLKKAGQEVEKAKEFTRAKNKRGTSILFEQILWNIREYQLFSKENVLNYTIPSYLSGFGLCQICSK